MSLAARSLQTRTLLAMKNYQECEKSLVLWFQVSPVSKEAEIVLGKFLEATR
jgi:hypothetical protein